MTFLRTTQSRLINTDICSATDYSPYDAFGLRVNSGTNAYPGYSGKEAATRDQTPSLSPLAFHPYHRYLDQRVTSEAFIDQYALWHRIRKECGD